MKYVAILCLLLVSGCKREERQTRVDPPLTDRVHVKTLVSLAPGGQPPPPGAKNAYEENAFAMSEGKRLYSQFNCVGCHAHGGGGMGPPLMDAKWIYGAEPEQVFATILEGRPNGMPAFRGHLVDFQAWQLAAYVRSMSGLANPNAAPGRADDMKGKPPENSVDPQPPKQSFLPPSAETR